MRGMLRPTSTRRVWVLLHQTGAQHCAGAYTSAVVEVFSVNELAPHPVPARRGINALLVMTLPQSTQLSQPAFSNACVDKFA